MIGLLQPLHSRAAAHLLSHMVLAYPQFGLTAAQVSKRFDQRIRALDRTMPEGYSLELGGESEQRNEAEANLLGGAIYAVLGNDLLGDSAVDIR